MHAQRLELVEKVGEIIDASTIDPAQELIQLGDAMMKIGRALKDLSVEDARKVIRAVIELQ